MNISSSSNGLSWTAPVPHFFCLFLVLVVVVVVVFCCFFVFKKFIYILMEIILFDSIQSHTFGSVGVVEKRTRLNNKW